MKKDDWISLGKTVVVTLVVLFIIKYFIITPVIVKGDSMDPTLANNERVMALVHSRLERFDIVTFPAPDEEGRNYIKRIIGLPGDSIEYKDDQLYINGKKYAEPYLDEYKKALTDNLPLTEDFTLETLYGQKTVPEGKLFVMGDNRRISKDSRIIGFIDKKDVSGNVKFCIWPPKRIGTIN